MLIPSIIHIILIYLIIKLINSGVEVLVISEVLNRLAQDGYKIKRHELIAAFNNDYQDQRDNKKNIKENPLNHLLTNNFITQFFTSLSILLHLNDYCHQTIEHLQSENKLKKLTREETTKYQQSPNHFTAISINKQSDATIINFQGCRIFGYLEFFHHNNRHSLAYTINNSYHLQIIPLINPGNLTPAAFQSQLTNLLDLTNRKLIINPHYQNNQSNPHRCLNELTINYHNEETTINYIIEDDIIIVNIQGPLSKLSQEEQLTIIKEHLDLTNYYHLSKESPNPSSHNVQVDSACHDLEEKPTPHPIRSKKRKWPIWTK